MNRPLSYRSRLTASRITTSMRFHLWLPLIINSSAFGWALGASAIEISLISICTCLTMSTSFVINDAVDRDVDRINGKRRWVPVTASDYGQIALLTLVTIAFITSGLLILPPAIIAILGAALLLGVAYSFGPKRLPGVGNAIAALLVVSPAIAYLLLHDPAFESPVEPELVQAIVWAGFWTMFCREIRYDLYDREGDRRGGRATYAVVFGDRACGVLIAFVLLLAAWMLLSADRFRVLESSPAGWGSVVALYTVLVVWAFSAKAEPAFTFRTRVLMLFWPLSLAIAALL